MTIACGAISGFHGLVSSGTTSKQISKETHAKAVGYGDWIEIPTGVGFCQYFTRPGLDAVGLFDTELFGRLPNGNPEVNS